MSITKQSVQRSRKLLTLLPTLILFATSVAIVSASTLVGGPGAESAQIGPQGSASVLGTLSVAAYTGEALAGGALDGPPQQVEDYISYAPHVGRGDLDSTLFLHNLAGSETLLLVSFYSPDGTMQDEYLGSIGPHGSLALEQAAMSTLPLGFEGSAVIMADGPLATVVNLQPTGTAGLLSYNHAWYGNLDIALPAIMRDYSGWNTDIWVQSMGSGPTNLTISYYPYTNGSQHVAVDTIPADASHVYHQTDMPELGDSFYGFALIEADQPVAAIVEMWNTEKDWASAYNGTVLGVPTPMLFSPRQQKQLDGWDSTTLIMNTGTTDGVFLADWFSGDGSHAWTEVSTAHPGEEVTYSLSEIGGLPDGFDGSLVISTTQSAVALSSWSHSNALGDAFAAAGAIGPAGPSFLSKEVCLPRVAHVESEELRTEFTIQNAADVAATAAVTITFFAESGATTATILDSIPYRGSSHYATGDVSALGVDWQGAVTIASTQLIAVDALQLLGSEPSPTYTISGHVTDGSTNPMPAVTISATGGAYAITDETGAYSISGLAPGTYTLTPIKSAWTFTPTSRIVSVPPDANGQDFTGLVDCSESPVYSGIRHCTRGEAHILKINPDAVKFETTLANGYDKDDVPGECRDVNTPSHVSVALYPGPRCHIEGDDALYPSELVGEMATRDPDNVAAVAFNADYFEPSYVWGPQGLTVKNGDRFDGPCYGDDDGGGYNAVTKPSLAISDAGDVHIAIAGTEAPNVCNTSDEPYVTEPQKYWNTVGGGPLLVENGVSVVEQECDKLDQYCPYRFAPRARTAVGKTADGELIVVVVPESAGMILDDSGNPEEEDLSELMISLGVVDALNLDGGGSSQLWYNGGYLVPSSDSRPVVEAMLVYSGPPCPAEVAVDEADSSSDHKTRDAADLLLLYWQLRSEVLSASGLGQGYIGDYDQYGPEVTGILLADSDLRSQTALFLENAAPAFGSLLPDSTEDVELTQALYTEAEALVNDLANAGSQELQDVMFETWDDLALDEHIGETATEIWQQLPHHGVYLPLILR